MRTPRKTERRQTLTDKRRSRSRQEATNVIPVDFKKVDPPAPKPLPTAAKPVRRAITMADIESMEVTSHSLYEMSELEVKKWRTRLYAINKDGISHYYTRYLEGRYLMVWRMK